MCDMFKQVLVISIALFVAQLIVRVSARVFLSILVLMLACSLPSRMRVMIVASIEFAAMPKA